MLTDEELKAITARDRRERLKSGIFADQAAADRHALLAEVKRLRTGWRSVADGLPEEDREGKTIASDLLMFDGDAVTAGYYSTASGWYDDHGRQLDASVITHWMHQPPPPTPIKLRGGAAFTDDRHTGLNAHVCCEHNPMKACCDNRSNAGWQSVADGAKPGPQDWYVAAIVNRERNIYGKTPAEVTAPFRDLHLTDDGQVIVELYGRARYPGTPLPDNATHFLVIPPPPIKRES